MAKASGLITVVFAMAALNAMVAVLVPSSVFALLGLISFAILVSAIYRASPLFIVAVAPILFFWFTELFSGVFIEAGAYMVETRTLGEATGAFSRLSILYGFVLIVGWLTWSAFGRQAEQLLQEWTQRARGVPGEGLVLLAIAILLVFFLGFGMMNGFPLLQGVDRFAYRLSTGSQALISFLGNRYIMFALLGMIVAFGRRNILAGVLFVGLMAISLLYGEKFTSLVVGSLFFAMPIMLQRLGRTGRLPWSKASIAAIGLLVVVVPAILLNYGVLENPDRAVERLQQRAALQGQLWYLADRDYGRIFAFDAQSISVALRTLIITADQSQFSAAAQHHGMYYVMRPFTDATTMYWTARAGGAFVFAYAPYWLMTTGFMGLSIALAVTLSFSALVLQYVVIGIVERDFVACVIWIKITTWLLAGFTLGNTYFFFGIETLALFGIGVIWFAVVRRHLRFGPRSAC